MFPISFLRSWLHFKTTRKFLLFFCATTILPFLIMGGLLIHMVQSRLEERNLVLLNAGMRFTTRLYREELHKLEQSSSQFTALSIEDAYSAYLQTHQFEPLRRLLNRYQQIKNLDVVALINREGVLIANTQPFALSDIHTAGQILAQTRTGKPFVSIQQIRFNPDDTPRLIELVSVPIQADRSPHTVIGMFLVGRILDTRSPILGITHILPNLDVSVYALTPKGLSSVFSSDPRFKPPHIRVMPSGANAVGKQPVFSAKPYNAHAHNRDYRTLMSPLEDGFGKIIGYLGVSVSTKDVREFSWDSQISMIAFILLGIIATLVLGLWYKRSFIDPVNALSEVAQSVTDGDLGARLPLNFPKSDITQTLTSVNAMLQSLEENDRLRSNFISALTHDLRTPLIAQKRVLEIFEDAFQSQREAALAKLANNLLTSNDNLLLMVNRLLETYQYVEGHDQPAFNDVVMHDVVSHCFANLSVLAEKKHISLINHTAQNLPLVQADEDQIQRVFQNLVGNAIENLSDGCRVEISAHVVVGNHLEVAVSDNGPGIAPDKLSALFDRYFVGDRTRQKIGSGLGLYICKMIMQSHGGTIKASSPPGQGSTFTLTFPLQQVGV